MSISEGAGAMQPSIAAKDATCIRLEARETVRDVRRTRTVKDTLRGDSGIDQGRSDHVSQTPRGHVRADAHPSPQVERPSPARRSRRRSPRWRARPRTRACRPPMCPTFHVLRSRPSWRGLVARSLRGPRPLVCERVGRGRWVRGSGCGEREPRRDDKCIGESGARARGEVTVWG